MGLKIGQEFRDVIPLLSTEEINNLEQSLLTEGCRDAIHSNDYMMVQGSVLFVAVIFLLINFFVDLVYGV